MSACPLLLNCLGGIMPQERITVKFCRNHGAAQLVRSPLELAGIVAEWKKRPELPASIRQAMKSARPPSHPSDILRTIAALGVKADSTAAERIPAIEAVRTATTAAPAVPGRNRPQPEPVVDSRT
jgi:hypothetical protein